jgi:hypothetical protein
MKKLLVMAIAILFVLIGCNSEQKEVNAELPEGTRKIEVVEHMNGGGYTFIKANENGNELWVAIREMPVEAGDVYYFTDAMVMNNFESKSLNKTFESILFVDKVTKTPAQENAMNNSGMPGMASPDGHTKPKVEVASDVKITPLADGMSVEAVNKDKSSLSGKVVKVKGKVTKYNGGIMNRNWIHIQDGTGTGETADLTITSDQPAKVGDTIIIEGTVATDKDFGAGYFYEVIIENAKITVEEKS